MNLQRPLLTQHPFSGRRELNTRAARERDAWIETARMHAANESFWRGRAATRCELGGHIWVDTDDGAGRSCTCCGQLTPPPAEGTGGGA